MMLFVLLYTIIIFSCALYIHIYIHMYMHFLVAQTRLILLLEHNRYYQFSIYNLIFLVITQSASFIIFISLLCQ